MIVRNFGSFSEVPEDLLGLIGGVRLKSILDKHPLDANRPGRLDLLYTYPTGRFILHNEGILGDYRLRLTSAEFDARDGVKIRASYTVHLEDLVIL
jgi:hypothetical protein